MYNQRVFRRSTVIALAGFVVLLLATGAHGQIAAGTDVNTSQLANYQNECSIAKNPTNANELFASCNNAGPGLFAARSTDLGVTWTYPDPVDRTIADGDPGQGPAACCDPTLSWDSFGNLYLGYLNAAVNAVVVLISTDSGQTFTTLATFPGSVDQPTLVAADTTAVGAPVALWVVWNQSGTMRARGAAVTGLGTVGAFNPLQTVPGTFNCSFGDVAIAPSGTVVQVCQNPTGGQGPASIIVNTDADGLGPNNFGAAIVATTTNVGGFDFIPPQNIRSVDAEAGLAYDAFDGTPSLPGFPGPSPRFGRLYLVYTEETINESNDTDIMVRFSDDDGITWSAPIQVNDDTTTRSQFLPRIASNTLSGNIAVCWHDARNSPGNNTMQEYCTIATPTPPTPVFMANGLVSDGVATGTGSSPPAPGQADIQYGDYHGMTYFQGRVHPIWADDSNSTGNNPNGTTRYDAYTDIVSGGSAANEGDPHLRTVEGIRYDFQSAGEFTELRGDGMEVQVRMAPVATNFFPGPNPYTGLAVCPSLNTAVAARVGTNRVTYQPSLDGQPDPAGMQLRIDGVLTTLGSSGVTMSGGGRVVPSSVGNGITIHFPSGARLVATPGWWASQNAWYLNVNVYKTTATEGLLGALAPGSWLPALSDGSSLGPKPVNLNDRYDELYQTFADSWRVTNTTSLFDYASGMGTQDFDYPGWPTRNPPCEVPEKEPAEPLPFDIAVEVCKDIEGERNDSCVFDVMITGEVGFAETYLVTQKLEADEGDPPTHQGPKDDAAIFEEQ
ncbi:MAG: sialidase family protein [Acidobacteriota bacterium]